MTKKRNVDKKKEHNAKLKIGNVRTLTQAEEWLEKNNKKWSKADGEGKDELDRQKDLCLLHVLRSLGHTPEVVSFVFANSNQGSEAERATQQEWRDLNGGVDGRYDNDDDRIIEEGWCE
jgi:hypothetical protein